MPGRRERGWSEHEMVEYSSETLDTDLKTRISHGINFHTNISQSICELEVSHRTNIDSNILFLRLIRSPTICSPTLRDLGDFRSVSDAVEKKGK